MTSRAPGPVILVVLICATALAMLPTAAVGFTLRDHAVARAFVYSAVLLASIGGLIHLATGSGRAGEGALSHPFSILTLAYVILPCLMAIPLTEAIPGLSFRHAWFEMLSAFTTTGASLWEGEVSRALSLWRATVAWMGGLFVLVTVMALLAPLNMGGVELFRGRFGGAMAPTADPRAPTVGGGTLYDQTLERMNEQLRVILPVYLGLTLTLWVGLSILGTPPLVALILAMSTLSTSGIAPTGTETSVPAEFLIAGFLVFALSRRLWPGARMLRQEGQRRDPELLMVAGILFVICLAVIMANLAGRTPLADLLATVWAHGFTGLSFLTTTGFVSSANGGLAQVFSGPAGMVTMGLALFGGGVATTAGGLKLMRVFALGWQARHEVSKLLYPDSVGGDGPTLRNMRRDGAFAAWLFLMIFIFSLITLSAALTLLGLTLEDAMIFAVAALTTTGPLPSIAAAEPLHWAALDDLPLMILAFGMVLGRLELLLLLSVLWRH